MKHSICVLGVLASLSPWAAAQSSVSIYGVIDVAVEHLTNVGTAKEGINRMPNQTATVPSRLGFRGSEDLGGGLRAVFTLEMGYSADTGVLGQGGRGFGRLAYVGFAGPWGSVTLGRNYTMLFWSLIEADVLIPSAHSSGTLDSYIPNPRIDNSIAYRGVFDGLTVGATYSLGRDAVNAGPSPAGTNCPGESASEGNACKEWSALVKYDTKQWGASLVIDELRGGPGAFAGLNTGSKKDTRTGANGYVKIGEAKLAAGVINRRNEGSLKAPKSNLWFVGATYPVTDLFYLEASVYQLKFKDSEDKATLSALRGTYHLSKRTAIYASLAHIKNDGLLATSVSGGAPGNNPVAGGSQVGLMTGVRHWF